MTPDQLLDAHMQRLRTDPGYSAIWQRANSRLYPDMKLIVAMLAWAEQADGLRAMAQHAGQAQSPPRGHYDADKLSRICTTWTRTDERCSDCGSAIMRGQCDGRSDVFACSGCAAVFADVEMSPNVAGQPRDTTT